MESSVRMQAVVLKCGRPCEFEYRNGKFYVTDPALGFTREMPVDVMARSFQNAARALDLYYSTPDWGAEIIQFPGRMG